MNKSIKYFFLLSLLFIGLSWLIPNHYLPWLTSHSDFLAFLSLFFLSLATFFSIKRIVVPKKVILFFLFLMFIPFFQFFFGKIFFFGDALISSLYLLGFLIAYSVGYNLAEYKIFIYKYFFMLILFVSILSVYIVLKQWMLLTSNGVWIVEIPPGGRPFANFAQPNNCSTFLSIGLMATLYLYEKKYINSFSGIIISIFILFGIALCQSRTAWIFVVLFIFWWLFKTRNFNVRLNRYLIFYFFSLFALFVLIIPFFSDYLDVMFTKDIITRATTGHLRIPMWHQMLLAIANEPLVGYGWNQVSVAQLSIYLDYPTTEWVEHSHNIFLDLLVWNGIPIGVFIIIFLCLWLYEISKLVNDIESFISLSMVGIVLIHAMLEYPLDYAFFLLPVGFLLGNVQYKDDGIEIVDIKQSVLKSLIIFSSITYVWIFFEYRIVEKDIQLLRFEMYNIGELHSNSATPNILLLTQLKEQIRFSRTIPHSNMSRQQLDWMRRVAYRYATPYNLYHYAQALALNDKNESAKKHLLILEKLYGRKYMFKSLYDVNQSLAFEWHKKSVSK